MNANSINMNVMNRFLLPGLLFLTGLSNVCMAQAPSNKSEVAAGSRIIAKINGQPVTAGESQVEFFLNQLPEGATEADRKKLLNKVIDRELVKRHLKSIQVHVDEEVLGQEIDALLKISARQGESSDEVLKKLKLTRDGIRELLWVDAAWKVYTEMLAAGHYLNMEWEARMQEYDGTRVKAAQIVFHVPVDAPTAQWQDAMDRMKQLRKEIEEKKITFADAAKRNSQSPSGRSGGDMGEFEFRGRVDEAISAVAFQLQAGEMSEPFRTRFGVHLVQTLDRTLGQLNLEDARPEILGVISKRMWGEVVRKEREASTIEILNKPL